LLGPKNQKDALLEPIGFVSANVEMKKLFVAQIYDAAELIVAVVCMESIPLLMKQAKNMEN
jgi:hypothetical protein